MKICGFISSKGGVGKTTNCGNLGAILADKGLRVLMIDTDPMQGLSHFYSIERSAEHGLTRLMKTASTEGCISETSIKNLHIILSDDTEAEKGGAIQLFLNQAQSRYLYFTAAMRQLAAQDVYDVVLVDTRGASGIIQEAVIYALDEIISPFAPTVMDLRELLSGTLDSIAKLNPAPGMPLPNGNRELPPVRILMNKADDRTRLKRQIEASLRQEAFRSDLSVSLMNSIIPQRVKLGDEALNYQGSGYAIPAHRLEKRRKGGVSLSEVYQRLADELIPEASHIEPQW